MAENNPHNNIQRLHVIVFCMFLVFHGIPTFALFPPPSVSARFLQFPPEEGPIILTPNFVHELDFQFQRSSRDYFGRVNDGVDDNTPIPVAVPLEMYNDGLEGIIYLEDNEVTGGNQDDSGVHVREESDSDDDADLDDKTQSQLVQMLLTELTSIRDDDVGVESHDDTEDQNDHGDDGDDDGHGHGHGHSHYPYGYGGYNINFGQPKGKPELWSRRQDWDYATHHPYQTVDLGHHPLDKYHNTWSYKKGHNHGLKFFK